MAIKIILIAFIFESILLVHSLVTKSSQERVRSIIWIGLFALFLVFIRLSVIEWGFRWFGLAILLFTLAIRGFWKYLKHPIENRNEFQSRKILNRTMRTLLFVVIATTLDALCYVTSVMACCPASMTECQGVPTIHHSH